MADFKIDTKEALLANLRAKQYAFESYTGRKVKKIKNYLES